MITSDEFQLHRTFNLPHNNNYEINTLPTTQFWPSVAIVASMANIANHISVVAQKTPLLPNVPALAGENQTVGFQVQVAQLQAQVVQLIITTNAMVNLAIVNA